MAVDTSIIGAPTGAFRVAVERGPVQNFAAALHDDNPVYRRVEAAHGAGLRDIPVPPTFSFAMQHWGTFAEDQPADPTEGRNVMGDVMGELFQQGGIVLHGEQEFRYHRDVCVGDVLVGEGRVTDVYEKDTRGSTMTFLVMETVWRDEATGEPAVTTVFNLIHRV